MLKLRKHGLIATVMLLSLQGFLPAKWEAGGGIAYANENTVQTRSSLSAAPLKPITGMTVGKARYGPGEKASFTLHFDQSVSWSGKVKMQIYQADILIAEGTKPISVVSGQVNNLNVEWLPPTVDFRGYLAKAWIEGSGADSFVTAAIDVSSNWTHFPRYGFVGEFPQETAEQSDAKMKQLSQDYYINGYQFYDWMWRHDVSVYSKTDENGNPLKDAYRNFITAPIDQTTTYHDLLGRELRPLTVKQEVAAAQKYGSAAMAYEMNYAARENYQQFGVKPEWGLYNKTAPTPPDPSKDQVGFFFDQVKPKPTGLYLQDPGNADWRSYITKQYNRAVNEFGFDGIHLDQWGADDKDYLLDYNGQQRHFSLDYNKIINSTKDSLTANNPNKSHVAFNMVGGNARYSTVPNPGTKTDFDYSELWQDMDHYKDIQKVIYDTRNKDGNKAMVIAGYMNYKQATGINYSASEAKDVPQTLVFQSRINKSPSWVGDLGKKDEDQVIFTVNLPADGMYDLTFHYGHGNSGGYPDGRLSVNDSVAVASIPFDQNTGWGNPVATKKVSVSLRKGDNKLKLQLNSNDLWLNLQKLDVASQSSNAFFNSYQAIFAELISCKVDHYGRVYNFETDGDYVQFEVTAPAEGDYNLGFSYGNLDQAVKRSLYVNDAKSADLTFAPTGAWDKFKEGVSQQVHLKQGSNIITVKAEGVNDTGVNLQYVKLNDRYYMAEDAKFGWAPTKPALIQKVPGSDASTVGYISEFKQKGDFVKFQLGTVTSDTYAFNVTYKNQGAETKRIVYANGRKAGTLTLPSTGEQWTTVSSAVYLPAANHTNAITLKMEDESEAIGILVDKIEVNGLTLEAENAQTGWEPVVPRKSSVSMIPAKTDNFGTKGQYVEFQVDVTEPVELLGFTYRSGNNPVLSIDVDGQQAAKDVVFGSTPGGWGGAMAVKSVPVQMQPGKHTVRAVMESQGQYINLSSLIVGNDEYGVENAATSDNSVSLAVGYASDFKDDGDFITFDTSVPVAGVYNLEWRYASDSAQTVQRAVYVNNGPGQTVSFAPTTTGVWANVYLNGITLNQGLNQITVRVPEADDDGIKLDHLKLTSSSSALNKIYEAEKANALPPIELYKDTVLNFGHLGDQVSFDVNAPQSGEASIIYTYSNDGPNTYRNIYVDGQRVSDLSGNPGKVIFEGTGNIETYSEDGYFIIPYLSKGAHRITLKMEEDDGKGNINVRSATLGYFNEPSLRLMDAGLAAMGATHIELGTAEKIENGPNLIAHEYFPNRSKKVLNGTKDTLKEYYKFFAAYENLLFDSKEDVNAAIKIAKDGQPVALSTDGSENTLWYTVRKNTNNAGFERYDVLHLINLLNNDDNWRNAASEAVVQNNLKVTYPVGMTKDQAPNLKVYAASPDSDHGMFKELTYSWNGKDLIIDVPSLSYWSMIFIDRNPQQGDVQDLFKSNAQSSEHDNDPTEAPAGTAPVPANSSHEQTPVQVVKTEELKHAQGDQVTIKLDGKNGGTLSLPTNTGEILGNNRLVVKTSAYSLTFDPGLFLQLKEKVQGKLDDKSQVYLTITPVKDPAASGLHADDPSMKQIGDAVNFELGISTADGTIAYTDTFSKPVEWLQTYDATLQQAETLGVYYFNDSLKAWQYIGGKIDPVSKTIRASLPHFSKFAVFAYDKSFTDVPADHWAFRAVKSLTAKHIVTGMTDSVFAPSAKTTRAQFAALLVRALGLEAKGASPFADAGASEWYSSAVTAAYEANIVTGKGDTVFAPDDVITREEMAAMLLRAYELRNGHQAAISESGFIDANSISDWAKNVVNQASGLGLMIGDGDGRFSPLRDTSRAEAAQAISNLLGLVQQ